MPSARCRPSSRAPPAKRGRCWPPCCRWRCRSSATSGSTARAPALRRAARPTDPEEYRLALAEARLRLGDAEDLNPLLALAGALSLAVAMGIGRFAFTPMLPLMLGENLLDVERGGWLAAANYAGYLAGALTAARVPLRGGALTVLALLATAALTAAMALSTA